MFKMQSLLMFGKVTMAQVVLLLNKFLCINIIYDSGV